jgi:formylmethanofuran dehydrogenase subunit E
MNFDHEIFVETEEEKELLDKLAQLRQESLEMELSDEEYGRLLIACGQLAMMKNDSRRDASQTDQVQCPECGEPVREAETVAIGEPPVLKPCGHSVEWEDTSDELRELIIDD